MSNSLLLILLILNTQYSILITQYSLLNTHYSILITQYSLRIKFTDESITKTIDELPGLSNIFRKGPGSLIYTGKIIKLVTVK